MKFTEVFSDYIEGKTPKDIALDMVAVGSLALFAKTIYEAVSHREPKRDMEEES